MSGNRTSNTSNLANLRGEDIRKDVIPRLQLDPLPEKLLSIVPEMRIWMETQNSNIERWRVRANIALNGGAS